MGTGIPKFDDNVCYRVRITQDVREDGNATGMFGKYVGDWPYQDISGNFKNPRIILDNGDVIWGIECWWERVEPDTPPLRESVTLLEEHKEKMRQLFRENLPEDTYEEEDQILVESMLGTLEENYPEGYLITYGVYLHELERRGVINPAQYFPVQEDSTYRALLQLHSMEDEMGSLDMWEESYAEHPGKYPNRYTPNEIVEFRNGLMQDTSDEQSEDSLT